MANTQQINAGGRPVGLPVPRPQPLSAEGQHRDTSLKMLSAPLHTGISTASVGVTQNLFGRDEASVVLFVLVVSSPVDPRPRPRFERPGWRMIDEFKAVFARLIKNVVGRLFQNLLHVVDVTNAQWMPPFVVAILPSDHFSRRKIDDDPVRHIRIARPQRLPPTDGVLRKPGAVHLSILATTSL